MITDVLFGLVGVHPFPTPDCGELGLFSSLDP